MSTLTKPVVGETLGAADRDTIDIDWPDDMIDAWLTDENTISIVVPDPDGGSYLDDPSKDNSGEDAWEWISFSNGAERDAWATEHGKEPNLVWIERYEHGLVNYAPIGEASVIDRQWDVASGVAVIRFKKDAWPDTPNLGDVARSICQEYTSWCNGDVYGIVSYRRQLAVDAPHSPVLIPDEFATDRWVETDTCWGFVGHEYANQAAKEGT